MFRMKIISSHNEIPYRSVAFQLYWGQSKCRSPDWIPSLFPWNRIRDWNRRPVKVSGVHHRASASKCVQLKEGQCREFQSPSTVSNLCQISKNRRGMRWRPDHDVPCRHRRKDFVASWHTRRRGNSVQVEEMIPRHLRPAGCEQSPEAKWDSSSRTPGYRWVVLVTSNNHQRARGIRDDPLRGCGPVWAKLFSNVQDLPSVFEDRSTPCRR